MMNLESRNIMSKTRAIEVIDRMIAQLQGLLKEHGNQQGMEYEALVQSAYKFVAELDPDHGQSFGPIAGRTRDIRGDNEDFITGLLALKMHIENTWSEDSESAELANIPIPFVAKSFRDQDKEINSYFEAILKALSIEYKTGERYSPDSIPEKIRKRISDADICIGILARREELKTGKCTTGPTMIRELEMAQGQGKSIIVLAEEGLRTWRYSSKRRRSSTSSATTARPCKVLQSSSSRL